MADLCAGGLHERPRSSEFDGISAPARVERQVRERARCQANAYDACDADWVLFECGARVAERLICMRLPTGSRPSKFVWYPLIQEVSDG